MRIAILQRFLPSQSRGGVGHFTHGLANTLVHRGHSVTVFTQDPVPQGAVYKTKVLPSNQSNKWLNPLTFPFQLAKLSFQDFDVIHAQGDDQWISRKSKIPTVRTLHGSAQQEALYNGLLRGSLKSFLMHLYFYCFELLSVIKADAVAGVSKSTLRHYPKFNRLQTVIPNGIDLKRFSPSLESKSEHPSILFVGEIKSRKRGDLLVKIFQDKIRPIIPNAELWLVSPEKQAGEGIAWMGQVDEHKLSELYRRAWVFCLPSSYEGFGRPYVEAMASGTVVAATPNPGACEILDNGKWGILASKKSLGTALIQLLQNPSLRGSYQEKGLLRACDYSWDRVTEQYEKIYQRIITNAAMQSQKHISTPASEARHEL